MNVTHPASHASMSRTSTIPLTCVQDGCCHLVGDDQMAAGRRARTGRFLALCGYTVTAAPMVYPAGRPCAECAAQPAPSSGDRARRLGGHHRRPGPLRRMLTRRAVPTTPTAPPARVCGWGGRALAAAGPEPIPTCAGPAASPPTRAVS